ncbi:MAG: quinone-dependent dihydroorotate dehydrogenase [Alicyclobacillus sp.]|nr:quinone-dependent dihydroorotate dehydrogenase [Alicyclobacillus sp.]
MYRVIRPLLFQLAPERAHCLTLAALARTPRLARLACAPVPTIPTLTQELWGLRFPHPIALAAGLDKNAEAVEGFFHVGFSAVEVGTVTPRPQPGNPRPRLFRLVEDEALVNRMGFNNDGADAMASRLAHTRRLGIIGVNLGKNKTTPNARAVDDYLTSMRRLYEVADYFVMNVSSPNTPGLRDLQAAQALLPLVQAALDERDRLARALSAPRRPVLVKLAPDLADDVLEDVCHQLALAGVDGLIATNTTVERTGLHSQHQRETGGLSGRPLFSRATEVVRLAYRATGGQLPIVASGGVFDASDAYAKVLAGASLVQLYTALIYRGPGVVGELVRGLAQRLRADGYAHLQEAIGRDAHAPHRV